MNNGDNQKDTAGDVPIKRRPLSASDSSGSKDGSLSQELDLDAIIKSLDSGEKRGASRSSRSSTAARGSEASRFSRSSAASRPFGAVESSEVSGAPRSVAASRSAEASSGASGVPRTARSTDKFDPNATVEYATAGESYPELPFAGTRDGADNGVPTRTGLSTATALRAATDTPTSKTRRKSEGTAGTPRQSAGSRSARLNERIANAKQTQRLGSSLNSAANKVSRVFNNTETRRVSNPLDNSDIRGQSPYRPIDIHRSTYRIRGGGTARKKSPLGTLVAALVVVAGLVIMSFGLFQLISAFGSGGGTGIKLTPSQTREAIDTRIPLLSNIIYTNFDETIAGLQGSGQALYANDRYRPDSPDPSAQGKEVISTPVQMTEEQIVGFYEGSYNAYSPAELEQHFNGAYSLDMARGDLGNWDKLKYVNLSATSVDDEITRLMALQELTGDSVSVTARGNDSRGNTVVQGTKAIGDAVVYFKVAACPFGEIYKAQKLSGTSVYATCTLATYDFYTGADTIT